jgi:hypothetical protein
MPRYRFTAKDLAPIKPLLNLPFAKQIVGAAVPVKRFEKRIVREALPLAVGVRSRREPDGVPLEALLKEVQKVTPTATGISVRRGKLLVTHSKKPTPAEGQKLEALVRDTGRLRELTAVRPAPRAAASSASASSRASRADTALIKTLRDARTSDERWLEAFREYAVKHLIKD